MAFVFADVSGHGMAAAFITALIKTAFQHCVEHGESLEMLVALANRNLLDLTPDESFAALIAGAYDPVARRLTYVNCGHAPGVILIPADAAADVEALPDGGTMILGVLGDPGVNVLHRDLVPGDRVFLSTDGNTEAMNVGGEMFGQPRLLELLRGARGRDLQTLVRITVDSVDEFAADTAQTDDRTLLAFEVRP
jgi:sigma-B regulation protein RsbU (phosphoserine phosphatase)